MKSYKVLENENSEELDVSKKINNIYVSLFSDYEEADENSIIILRVIIKTIFSHMREEELKDENYKEKLNSFLYPRIYFVGLANLYSLDKKKQLKFLEIIEDELKTELDKNNDQSKEKIK